MRNTHLASLKIRGFRGLSSLDLDGLGTFNILLGANDVGKTSILEAIFLLSGSANMQLPLKALKDVLSLPEFSGYRQTTNCYVLQRDKSGLVHSYKYEYRQYEHNIEHDIEIR